MEVFPSPKFQFHDEIPGLPVERSLNWVALLKQTGSVLAAATGGGPPVKVTGNEMVSTHPSCEVTISVTVYDPGEYAMLVGF